MKTIFEWDEGKNKKNIAKHKVSFKEAQEVFFDQYRVITIDKSHSTDEKRYYCIGKVKGGVITVRFTNRLNRIRIIGAGFWRKGKKVYEEQNKIY